MENTYITVTKLVDTYVNRCEDKVEALEDLEMVHKRLTNNPQQFIKLLKTEIEDVAKANNICPNCHSELTIKTWHENRGEYQGFNCTEECSKLVCGEFCGWEDDG
jgi:uncharacterized protein YlaI